MLGTVIQDSVIQYIKHKLRADDFIIYTLYSNTKISEQLAIPSSKGLLLDTLKDSNMGIMRLPLMAPPRVYNNTVLFYTVTDSGKNIGCAVQDGKTTLIGQYLVYKCGGDTLDTDIILAYSALLDHVVKAANANIVVKFTISLGDLYK